MSIQLEKEASEYSLNSLIFLQLVKYLYELVYVRVAVVFISTIIIYFILKHVISHSIVDAWLAMSVAVLFIRVVASIVYTRTKLTPANVTKWFNIYIVLMLLMGITYGAAGILASIPDSIIYVVTVDSILLGIALAMLMTNIASPRAFYVFLIPLVILGVSGLMYHGSELKYLFALVVVIMSLGLVLLMRTHSKNYIELITLRYKLATEKQKAEKANSDKTRFLAAASHDLRQPLHALNLFSGLLKHHANTDMQRELLFKVDSALLGLNSMLEKLLDISRLDAGVLECNIKSFSLRTMLNNLCEEFEGQAINKGLMFESNYNDTYVKSDPVLLEDIIRNFLSNAIRYTETGRVSIVCREVTENGCKLVSIEVSDTGIGIGQEYQEEIFSEYTQIDNPERDQSKGLGLGLAIVKRIARLIGSEVHVDSRLGEGSTFTVKVPLGQFVNKMEIARQPHEIESISVLIIDDDQTILAAMKDMLSVWGCDVLVAESCHEAISRLKRSGFLPDIIISDYRLRNGQTGADAIKRVHDLLGNAVPAYLRTGDTAPERIKEASLSGYELLHKPLKTEVLKSILGTVSRSKYASISLDTEIVCN